MKDNSVRIRGADIKFIPNQKYSELTYLKDLENRKYSPCNIARVVLCRCSCGAFVDVLAETLAKDNFHACRRCLQEKQTIPKKDIRVQNPRLWSIYQGMLYRCLKSKIGTPDYRLYRGRGITVCSEWQSSFDSFVRWALSHGYDSKLSIDRIDVNGNYTPDNCRWADQKTQNNNQRPRQCHKYAIIHGEKIDLKTASEKYHIPYARIYERYKKGIRDERLVAEKNGFYRSQDSR